MPEGAVPRVLHYVGLLFLFCLASTFAWWAAAQAARTEYRRLLSALACSMRVFFYSICLLCILVALKAMNFAPGDPRDPLFAWIHLGGTVLICIPSAWRALRARGPRLFSTVVLAWALIAATGWLATLASPAFRWTIENLPRHLTSA